MDNHALLSDAYDIAESLALSRRNPWEKLSPQDVLDTKIEILKHLRSNHAEKILKLQEPAHTFMAFVSIAQYSIYGIGLTVLWLLRTTDLSFLWWIFLFYAPLITLCMNYFLFRISPSVRKYRTFVQNLDQVIARGYERFLSSLEDLKYSSAPSSTAPKPKADLKEISPQQAEEFCAAWLRSLGFLDAQVTRFSRDGGIDVESQHLCAQVKHQTAPVGVKAVRELFGVAVHEKKTPVFFALSDYTSEAKTFATKVGMPIIRYFPNSLAPLNQPAELLISQGPKFVSSSRK